jgi:hypothetical protein
MNIDGLQELIMNRTTSSRKPDTSDPCPAMRRDPADGKRWNHSDGRLAPWHDNRRHSQHQSRYQADAHKPVEARATSGSTILTI